MATGSVLERRVNELSDLERRDRMDRLFSQSRAILDVVSASSPDTIDGVADVTFPNVAWALRDMVDELKELAR